MNTKPESKILSSNTTPVCVACQGKLINSTSRKYICSPNEAIYGPGSEDQIVTVNNGWNCEHCGLMYAFLPKPQ